MQTISTYITFYFLRYALVRYVEIFFKKNSETIEYVKN